MCDGEPIGGTSLSLVSRNVFPTVGSSASQMSKVPLIESERS